jgi:eukaryotic-like serine/threonine-protein kinase
MTASDAFIGQTISHYRILEKLGGGGMGVVYKAEDTRLKRHVALKFLAEEISQDRYALERFQREAQAASALNHPNICTIYDVGEEHGQTFLVMEFLEGQTLKERLAGWPAKPEEVAKMGMQAAIALEAAHAKGIVHCDIKPANLFVAGREQLKLMDFGLAQLLRSVSGDSLTETHSGLHGVAGTLPYMAPEQLRGGPVDARTDIYALGVVLYEMATGQRPFRGELAPQLIDAILHQPALLPARLNPVIPGELEHILLKCLEKDPENRYQSAKELEVDLRRLGAPSTTAAIRTATPARAPWRWPLVAGTAVALAAGIAIGLNAPGWLWHGSRPGRIESLAVLPLENLSGDPSQSYFADGMTEELITDLGQISSLRVISRTSVMHYKGTQRTIPEIARELHVDAVVEGSVERVGNQVRITAQLIEARVDRHLWAKKYERELRNALQLQDEVAQAIAREIQVKLTPQEQTRLASSRTVNPEAYDDYLKGRYFYYQWTAETDRKAHEYFQQAINKDPNYAPAWALWADTLKALELPPQESAKQAREALQNALQLDDSLAEVHTAIAVAKFNYEWDWAGGARELRRSIELNPNYAEAHHCYSHYLMAQGRVEDSLRENQRALDSDPLSLAMMR